jgi:hypothetical protein
VDSSSILVCQQEVSLSYQISHWTKGLPELWTNLAARTASLLSSGSPLLPCDHGFSLFSWWRVKIRGGYYFFLHSLSASSWLFTCLVTSFMISNALSLFLSLEYSQSFVTLTVLIHGISQGKLLICRIVLSL